MARTHQTKTEAPAKDETGASSSFKRTDSLAAMPAIVRINPVDLFKDDDVPVVERGCDARISIAIQGAKFLAALLIQNGMDADGDGTVGLIACPDWTYGVGTALAAVVDSIECAHFDLQTAANGRAES